MKTQDANASLSRFVLLHVIQQLEFIRISGKFFLRILYIVKYGIVEFPIPA